jgi:hypothetical protein
MTLTSMSVPLSEIISVSVSDRSLRLEVCRPPGALARGLSTGITWIVRPASERNPKMTASLAEEPMREGIMQR